MDMESILSLYKGKESWWTLYTFIIENKVEEAMNYIQTYCNCDENMAKEFFVFFSKLSLFEDPETFRAVAKPIGKKQTEEAMDYIQEFCNCDENMSKIILNSLIDKCFYWIYHPTSQSLEEVAHNNQVAQDLLNKPKCPICNSTNLTKITATKKIAKMAAFGIFGMGDNGKTWRCKNCGSKF